MSFIYLLRAEEELASCFKFVCFRISSASIWRRFITGLKHMDAGPAAGDGAPAPGALVAGCGEGGDLGLAENRGTHIGLV